jgi:hypothetical protein
MGIAGEYGLDTILKAALEWSLVFEFGGEMVCEPVKAELKGFESISHSASGLSLPLSAGELPRTNAWIRLSKQVESKCGEVVQIVVSDSGMHMHSSMSKREFTYCSRL